MSGELFRGQPWLLAARRGWVREGDVPSPARSAEALHSDTFVDVKISVINNHLYNIKR